MTAPHDNAGFSLIEIMISIAIIAIGLFAVMSLGVIVIKGNSHSKRVTTATILAQDKIENYKKSDYDTVGSETGIYTSDIDYYWVANVQNDTPVSNTKTIILDVYWSPGTTTSIHNVELQTILAE
ncbi:hypothetical protein KsCSTR_45200 [Candidatus Kuenenia stuttgartiensis]|nr:prepilin-type N-terminal cleavage/methylation domain-containing protein [Candidatus Kuenenia stuttgartiensis]QII13899.1 hypothetical protein KsCSTR_45200 [Candidatus Kuenenia stuttgartiensis]